MTTKTFRFYYRAELSNGNDVSDTLNYQTARGIPALYELAAKRALETCDDETSVESIRIAIFADETEAEKLDARLCCPVCGTSGLCMCASKRDDSLTPHIDSREYYAPASVELYEANYNLSL